VQCGVLSMAEWITETLSWPGTDKCRLLQHAAAICDDRILLLGGHSPEKDSKSTATNDRPQMVTINLSTPFSPILLILLH